MIRNLIIAVLLVASIIDIKHYIVPNFIPLIIFAVSIRFSIPEISIDEVVSIIILFTIFILAFLDKYIGMGDIKLLFSLFLFLGGHEFLKLLFIVSVLLFIYAILVIIIKKSKELVIPMVPFIFLSFIISGVI